ncbi:MAG: hypothetical protein AAGM67_16750, partial [Bacteroidota bacterium]
YEEIFGSLMDRSGFGLFFELYTHSSWTVVTQAAKISFMHLLKDLDNEKYQEAWGHIWSMDHTEAVYLGFASGVQDVFDDEVEVSSLPHLVFLVGLVDFLSTKSPQYEDTILRYRDEMWGDLISEADRRKDQEFARKNRILVID